MCSLSSITRDRSDPANSQLGCAELWYYTMAASLNHSKAMYKLGMHFKTKKNNKLMKRYLKQSAQLGNADALIELHWYYYDIQKYNKAVEYLQMAIDLNNFVAVNLMGEYHQLITGDTDEMLKHFNQAAEMGSTEAMVNLGEFYEQIGNFDKMKHFFEKAAGEGNSDGAYSLALYYDSIDDTENMVTYCCQAAYDDHAYAMRYLGEYYEGIDMNLAIGYYKDAAYNGDRGSMHRLAKHYAFNLSFIRMSKYCWKSLKSHFKS